MARDISRITASSVSDTPVTCWRGSMNWCAWLTNCRWPTLWPAGRPGSLKRPEQPPQPRRNGGSAVLEPWPGEEARGLLRVSRVEQPEAVLLSPEQSFFVRENLKLKLLNARLGLLARQLESARADMATSSTLFNRYFDPRPRARPRRPPTCCSRCRPDEEPWSCHASTTRWPR
jgi:uroporphyrin-3 C-methyltransferase